MTTLVLKMPNVRAEKLELVETLMIQNDMVLNIMKFSTSKDLKEEFNKTSKEINALLNDVSEIDRKHSLLSKNIILS